jgi:hypothetical protein
MQRPCDNCDEPTDESELRCVWDAWLCEECYQLGRTVLIEAGYPDPEEEQ